MKGKYLADDKRSSIIMPYCPLGSLDRCGLLSLEEVMELAAQLLGGCEYLHARNTAHRDYKPGNVLIQTQYPFSVLLTDFGFASREKLVSWKGTHGYAAPEIYYCSGDSYTVKVDIWSIGMIIWESCCLSPNGHYEGRDIRRNDELKSFLINSVARSADFEPLLALAKRTLNFVPSKRPSASVCLEVLNTIRREAIIHRGSSNSKRKYSTFEERTLEQARRSNAQINREKLTTAAAAAGGGERDPISMSRIVTSGMSRVEKSLPVLSNSA